MQTLLFYVSIIFEAIIILHHKLGSEHHHQDDRVCYIYPTREWLIDDHQDDTHPSDDKSPFIHLELLRLFALIVCLLAPHKKWYEEKSCEKKSHNNDLHCIWYMIKYIFKYEWNEKKKRYHEHEYRSPHTLATEEADAFFLGEGKHRTRG